MAPIIQIRNVHKLFSDQTYALQGIDLNIEQGEVVVIIGPSGSGKSTLLRCINRLETFEHGQILVDNLPTDTDEEICKLRTEIGMVFQRFKFVPASLGVGKYCYCPARRT